MVWRLAVTFVSGGFTFLLLLHPVERAHASIMRRWALRQQRRAARREQRMGRRWMISDIEEFLSDF